MDEHPDPFHGLVGSAGPDPRTPLRAHLLPAILQLLAGGRPVAAHALSRAAGLPPDLLIGMITFAFPGAEFDADGRLVGLGLSLIPTAHEVRLAGSPSPLYAWCAPDALLLPALLGAVAQVTSSCAGSGAAITARVGLDDVTGLHPGGAVVAFGPGAATADLRNGARAEQGFFASPDVAEGWVSRHPGTIVLPVAEAFRRLVRRSGAVALARLRASVDLGASFVRLGLSQLPPHAAARATPCRVATGGEPAPGDMWWDPESAGWVDSEAHRTRGGGPHLVVRLPNGWDWDIDGPMSNGSGWWRTGEAPHVTAMPSIVAGGYHGLLLAGRLYQIPGTAPR